MHPPRAINHPHPPSHAAAQNEMLGNNSGLRVVLEIPDELEKNKMKRYRYLSHPLDFINLVPMHSLYTKQQL